MEVLTSTRADGDLAVDVTPATLAERRAALVDLPWVGLTQVHGAGVVVAERANAGVLDGAVGDALVTADAELVLSVRTADCAPVALDGGEVIAVVHAGWRGLVAGVVAATVATMRSMGAAQVTARLGPCIGPECYEFGADDLAVVADHFGATAVGETAGGGPALDLRAAVAEALAQVDVPLVGPTVDVEGRPCTTGAAASRGGRSGVGSTVACTACDAQRWWSNRARGDQQRMVTAVWRGHR
ncbi:MAG: polyphenol oxidase family protein [Acidimicrobiia bacterium]|nr:polyphenol oxidase family protein [Acidimicrobiia bacterium]